MKRLIAFLAAVVLSLPGFAATLPVVANSAKVNGDGRMLSIQFSIATPGTWTNPLATSAKPTLTNGARSVQPDPIGAWYANTGGVLTWTVFYDIPPDSRVNVGETGWTCSWTSALAADQSSNSTAASGSVAVSNGARTDSSGWYAVPASVDSVQVYVDSVSGVDANPGTQALPKRTMAAAASSMRSGFPDRMYLARGGTYTWPWANWTMSGRSATEPIAVMAYGSGARPIIAAGTGPGFYRNETGSTAMLRWVTIAGLDFQQSGSLGTDYGFWWLGGGQGIWVEDCRFSGFAFGGTVQKWTNRISDFTFHRCSIVDSSAGGTAHSSGFYGTGIDNALFSENVWDQNGYNDAAHTTANQQNHNIYCSTDCTGLVFWENISTRASSDGVKFRAGGLLYGNVLYEDPIGINTGWNDADDPAPTDTGHVIVAKNVVISGSTLLPSLDLGWDIWAVNGIGGGFFDNLVMNNSSILNAVGLRLDGTYFTLGFSKFDVRNNIVWDSGGGLGGAVMFVGNGTQLSGVSFVGNVVNNTADGEPIVYHSQTPTAGQFTTVGSNALNGGGTFSFGGTARTLAQWKTGVGDTTSTATIPTYTDTSRTPAGYNGSIGGTGTKAAWYTAIRAQRNGNWIDSLGARATAAYFRAGFSTGATVPSAPTGLTGARTTTTTTISFPAVSGATSYTIRRHNTSGGAVAATYTGASPSNQFTGLTGATTYYYDAIATNGTGDSTASAEIAVKTAPAVVTTVAATPHELYVTYSWDASTDPAWRNYKVYKSLTGGAPWTLATTITGAASVNSFNIGGQPIQTITVYVTQTDSTGAESDASATAADNPASETVIPSPFPDPGPDQNVTDTDRTGAESVTLDASGSTTPGGTSITDYTWKENGSTISSGAGSTQAVSLAVGVHTIGLYVTNDYPYTVGPHNVTHTVTPTTATGLGSSNVKQNSGDVAWTAYTGASGYTVRWGLTTSYGTEVPLVNNGYTISGLAPSTTYHWGVRVDAPGVSGAWSSDQTFTTSAVVNHAPTAVATPASQIVVDTNRDGSEPVTVDSNSSTDPDGDTLAVTWRRNGNVVSTLTNYTSILPLGDNTLDLQVSDGSLTSQTSAYAGVRPNSLLGLAGSLVTSSSMRVGVTAYSGVLYKFEWGIGSFTGSSTVTTNFIDLGNLTADTDYQIRATPIAGSLSGAVSSTIIVHTLPAATQQPIANAGPDQTVTDTDNSGFETVTLNGSLSVDPDGTIVGYSWTEGTTLLGSGSIISVPLSVGSHTITLTVTDNTGQTGTDTVAVTVNAGSAPNVPPTCSLANPGTVQIVTPATDITVNIHGTAADSDGSILLLILAVDEAGVLNTSDSGEIANWISSGYDATGLTAGVHTAHLYVSDGTDSCQSNLQFTVLGPDVAGNIAPVADAGPAQTVTLARGTFAKAITMAGIATDADGTIATVQWKEDTTVLKTTPTNGTVNEVLASSITIPAGTHILTLRVVDDGGAVTTDTVQIVVNPDPRDDRSRSWWLRFIRFLRTR